jgi:catechol 2,3-dioxygenase-like lactoylglutathione lyase family enzyme
MLSSGKLVAFLFTTDYDRARDFFVNKLGCQFVSHDQFALVVTLAGSTIRITKIPDFTPAKGTVLGWEVKNIEAIVDWLTKQGVTLEKYPFVQDQERGIWTTPDGTKVAWFKDPDGNVLSVSEHF